MNLNFTWTDATTNVDGSALAPGEVTGYTIGIRNLADAGHSAGNYALTISAATATAVSAIGSAAMDAVTPGTYLAAIQSNGPVTSAWSTEVTFVVPVPVPVPNAPSGFSVVLS